MQRIRKSVFVASVTGVVFVLSIIKCINPAVATYDADFRAEADSLQEAASQAEALAWAEAEDEQVIDSVLKADKEPAEEVKEENNETPRTKEVGMSSVRKMPLVETRFRKADGTPVKNKIYSVRSYKKSFPDLQDVQIRAARKWGVSPVKNRTVAEQRKDELVFVGSSPYYVIDKDMNRSIPYLVPRADQLLQRISRNFLDSLTVKGLTLHMLVVSSVLRTEADIKKLKRYNSNASEQSCHRFGTTIDICYNRYEPVCSVDGSKNKTIPTDRLKWVLAEVLRDLREQGLCYVKYEVKQACFHITVR